jgi:hypothetical protein
MIISISGNNTNSGKDLVGKIIQWLSIVEKAKNNEILSDILYRRGFNFNTDFTMSSWRIKKFADKLKDIVCILLDCTREDLENEEFKNKELGEEWECFEVLHSEEYLENPILFADENLAVIESKCLTFGVVKKRNLTPRILLKLIGTECGREIIHPNIWVNSLMKGYKEFPYATAYRGDRPFNEAETVFKYPNWIITDVRFPNEYKAIQKQEHLHIHLERFEVGDYVTWNDPELDTSAEWEIFECYEEYALIGISGMGNREIECEAEVPYSELSIVKNDLHKSENTQLLEKSFDENVVYLYNVGDIEELTEKVKSILENHKII